MTDLSLRFQTEHRRAMRKYVIVTSESQRKD
jgi:hypothetical protein